MISKQETTFTVFAFGTGETSSMKEKSILSYFSESCTSPKCVLEGPTLLGTEVNPNATLAMDQIIDYLSKAGSQDKYVVNLTGLSRGAVTCIKIANLLKAKVAELQQEQTDAELLAKLEKLELNIFNLDPVAGMGDKMVMDARVIPSNVANYVSILQLDEMRRDFKPQDMSRTIIESPKTTRVSMLPLYGNHTSSIKVKDATMKSTAQIAHVSLYEFLRNHGTTFKNDTIPELSVVKEGITIASIDTTDAKALFNLFRQQHDERDDYLQYGKRFKAGDSAMFRKPRRICSQSEYYVADSDFFVNQSERGLFKVAFPRTFNYFFENNSPDPYFLSGSSKDEVITELREIKETDLNLYRSLIRKFGLEDEIITLGEPQGTFNLESCRMVHQLYPNLLPAGMNDSIIAERSTLSALKNDVIAMTLRYDREKSQFYTLDDRSQSTRAQRIRDEVSEIYANKENTTQDKQVQILDVLKKHIKFLQAANSASSLLGLLNQVLVTTGECEVKPPVVPFTTELVAFVVDLSLTLMKDTIYFVLSGGFVGGYVLSMVGHFLEDLGRRMKDAIGPVGYDPLKGVVFAVASAFEILGFVLKNHFGLKPIRDTITSGIRELRDQGVAIIRTSNGEYEAMENQPH